MRRSSIVESFERVRSSIGDAVAVHSLSEGRTLTFETLWQEAQAVGATLVRSALVPGAVVVAVVGNRAAFFSTLVAALDAGLVFAPLDGDTPLAEALAVAERYAARALIVHESAGKRLRESKVVFDLPGGAALATLDGVDESQGWYPDAAVFKFTSGSSGVPKAVAATEDNLVADGEHIIEAMGIGAADVNLAAIPLSHSYGLGNLVMPLLLQGNAVVLRDAFVPARFFRDVRERGATVMPGVPFMFDYIRQHLPADEWPRGLRLLISAGAPISGESVEGFHARFGVKVHSFYGASETGGIAYDASDEVGGPPTLGPPMPGTTITMRPFGEQDGRVHVRGRAVASGYALDEEDSGFGDGGFLTGDLGHLDARGRLVLTGRISRFINVAGRKVQPEEVERVLREAPGIRDARVIGVADAARGETIVAFVVGDTAAETVALRQHCAARLAPHKIPRKLVPVAAWPVDARGKTDRRALEALAERALGSR